MITDSARRYLIAYDIADDKRRARLAKRLSGYGDRIQYSVFLSDLKPAKLVRLRAAIREAIKADEDSVLICDLGPARSIDADALSYIGLERAVTSGQAIVI